MIWCSADSFELADLESEESSSASWPRWPWPSSRGSVEVSNESQSWLTDPDSDPEIDRQSVKFVKEGDGGRTGSCGSKAGLGGASSRSGLRT